MKKIGTTSSTKKIVKDNDFYIKKKFGQNFLTDQNILRKIVNIPEIDNETLVVEIGPGLGSLTEHLLETSKHVLAYEIDNDLIPILKENFKEKSLTLINDDILKRKIDSDIENLGITYKKAIVVANLPYYITTPIIMKILEESKIISGLVVMMQHEVAMRFTGKPSTKDYNSLSVVIQYKTDSKIALKVPKSVFIPAPNVDSAIVHMKVKENIDNVPNNEQLFFELVRNSFKQRRKTLVNNLSSSFGLTKSFYADILVELGHSESVRAEKLTVNDFIELSNVLNEEMPNK